MDRGTAGNQRYNIRVNTARSCINNNASVENIIPSSAVCLSFITKSFDGAITTIIIVNIELSAEINYVRCRLIKQKKQYTALDYLLRTKDETAFLIRVSYYPFSRFFVRPRVRDFIGGQSVSFYFIYFS